MSGGTGKNSELPAAILRALYSSLESVRTTPPASNVSLRWIHRLLEACQPILDGEGVVRLQIVRHALHLNDRVLPPDIETFVYHERVTATLRSAGITRLELRPGVDARGLETFLRLVARVGSPDSDRTQLEAVRRAMVSRGVRQIEVFGPAEGAEDEGRRASRRAYSESIEASRQLFTGARLGRVAQVAQVRLAVQNIVEAVLTDEASLGGLSMLKDFDEYAFTHAVNVCIYCVAIGRRLGLTKVQLYDLGHAALVHDLGMSRVPHSILEKGSTLTVEERQIVASHTWLGALSVFGLRDFGEIPLQSMVVAYEHHLRPDGTGYPEVVRPREPGIFTKIIAVASAFDAATNERAYQKARPPDTVLAELWRDESLGYDPVVVKALINLLGIYPIGTCVILDGHELALVHSANGDPAYIHRPVVRLLCDANGVWLHPAPLVDLSTKHEDGSFLRSIIKVTDPERYGVKVADYLG